jgi:hypothetical protein
MKKINRSVLTSVLGFIIGSIFCTAEPWHNLFNFMNDIHAWEEGQITLENLKNKIIENVALADYAKEFSNGSSKFVIGNLILGKIAIDRALYKIEVSKKIKSDKKIYKNRDTETDYKKIIKIDNDKLIKGYNELTKINIDNLFNLIKCHSNCGNRCIMEKMVDCLETEHMVNESEHKYHKRLISRALKNVLTFDTNESIDGCDFYDFGPEILLGLYYELHRDLELFPLADSKSRKYIISGIAEILESLVIYYKGKKYINLTDKLTELCNEAEKDEKAKLKKILNSCTL